MVDFKLFRDLPPELRMQIWRASLPDRIQRALQRYRKGYWKPRHLTQADIGYEPNSADDNFVLEFCYSCLGPARLNIPLAAINDDFEARDVIITWADEQGIEIRQDGHVVSLVCTFQPERDLLYVPLDDWYDLFLEPIMIPFELEIFEDKAYSTRNEVYHVAVPETLLRQDRSASFTLDALLDYFPELKAVYVVLDPQPDFRPSPRSEVPWRREVAESQLCGGWEFVWNSTARGWHVRSGEAAQAQTRVSGDLYQLLLQAVEELQWAFQFENYKHVFKVHTLCLEAAGESSREA